MAPPDATDLPHAANLPDTAAASRPDVAAATLPVRLVDAHAHLQADAFAGDVDEVIASARAAGVERLLVPAWDLDSTRLGLELVRSRGLRTTAGIHPHVAAAADAQAWSTLRDLARSDEVAGIGETGLDYDRGFSPREAQLANLRQHLDIALELGKPLILHCRSAPGRRDAQDDLIAELRSAGVGEGAWRDRFGPRPTGMLHSFSGPLDYAQAALGMNLAISFSGLVFRRGEEASAEVATIVPAEQLLVETDAPYLKPRGVRGRRNEPRHVAVTAAWLREQRGDDPDAFGEALVAAFDGFVGGPSGREPTGPG